MTGKEKRATGRENSIPELRKSNAELTALLKISHHISSTIWLNQLLAEVLKTVLDIELFRLMKQGGIFLLEGADMHLAYSLGSTPEFIDAHTSMKVGLCLCGRAAQSGEILASSDCLDERHEIAYPGIRPHGHVIVPLKAADDTLGVMYLYLPAGARLESRTLEIFRLIGGQVGVAIRNAQIVKGELDARETALKRETVIAETLQTSLLPEKPEVAGIDLGLVYRPAGKIGRIGGDFYDFFFLRDDRLAVVIGDASGHGLASADHDSLVKYTLRAYLYERQSPGECLTRLNWLLFRELAGSDRFMTACILVIDVKKNTISFASAGHYPPVICGPRCKPAALEKTQPPLGVLPDQKYQSLDITTDDIGHILLFTDGLIEARSSDGGLFGLEGMLRVLRGSDASTAQELADRVAAAAFAHADNRLNDDLAVIVVGLNRRKSDYAIRKPKLEQAG